MIMSEVSGAVSYKRGVMLVLAAGVLWSTVGLGVRLIEDANVWQILLYRSCSLTPFLFVVLYLRSGEWPFFTIRRAGWAGVVAGLALVLAYGGGVYSIQKTTVANALLLFATAPFMTAILARLWLGERVRSATILFMVIAVGGVAIMVMGDISSGNLAGNLAARLSALGFAVFTVALRQGKNVDMLPAVFLSGLFTMGFAAVISGFQGWPLTISVQDTSIALMMGVLQIGLGLVLYTIGSSGVPAAELPLLSLGEVVLGPLWVWLVLGETVSLATFAGGAILLTAIAANAYTGLRERAASTQTVSP